MLLPEVVKNSCLYNTILDTRISAFMYLSHSGNSPPPRILKQGGLESSGWILKSSTGGSALEIKAPFSMIQGVGDHTLQGGQGGAGPEAGAPKNLQLTFPLLHLMRWVWPPYTTESRGSPLLGTKRACSAKPSCEGSPVTWDERLI